LILVGHGGLDPQTLAPTGRLTRVVYEIRGRGRDAALFRSQEYLDEPTRPERWTELVALDVVAFSVVAGSGDVLPVRGDRPYAVDEPDETPEAVAKRRRVPQ